MRKRLVRTRRMRTRVSLAHPTIRRQAQVLVALSEILPGAGQELAQVEADPWVLRVEAHGFAEHGLRFLDPFRLSAQDGATQQQRPCVGGLQLDHTARMFEGVSFSKSSRASGLQRAW